MTRAKTGYKTAKSFIIFFLLLFLSSQAFSEIIHDDYFKYSLDLPEGFNLDEQYRNQAT